MRPFLLLVLVLSGCAAGSVERRSAGATRLASPTRCDLAAEVLRCRWSSVRPPAVVARDVVGYAPRLGGGAFVLRHGGLLERYGRTGRLTGAAESPFESLVAAGRYVCGASGGGIACFRDGHEDLTCPTSAFGPALEPMDVVPPRPIAGSPAEPVLRVGRAAYRIGGTCAQHCVQLGCDGPRRCMDPCRPGQRARLVARPLDGGPSDFFSK